MNDTHDFGPEAVPGSEPGASVAVGLPDRYEDLGLIATGGFGEVRRVRDRVLGNILAMKILLPDAAGQPEVHERFLVEARLTARLSHPGIVAVQDLGELPDGRAWYTMEEVRGRTLSQVIEALDRRDPTWTLRRVVDMLERACQAVAAAHAEGVVHRDIKPDNVMIGAFGEVRVMDWGLARQVGFGDEDGVGMGAEPSAANSVAGRVMGTPAYMPPEQARGEPIGPTADVYALGATLYRILAGRPPYLGDARAAWRAVLTGPPADIFELAGRSVPEELCEICAHAMTRNPAWRYPHAAALALELSGWLDGARKRQEALALVDRARRRLPDREALRARSGQLEAEARRALDGLPPNAPTDMKVVGWRLEEQARATRVEAGYLDAELIRDLRAALVGAPELPAAHELLADIYQERLVEAEGRGDRDAIAELEVALRAHDRGRHAAWIQGHGAVTLITEPPGARVTAFRYEEQDRRLVEVPAGELGVTPLQEVPLPRGSYMLVLTLPGHERVRYPVSVGRLEHWDGVRPGEDHPSPIHLPRQGELGPNEVYVPPGWFLSGADPQAIDALPGRRLWVDGLRVSRFPVTNEEYLAFLNDGQDERWCPRDPVTAKVLFERDEAGRFVWLDKLAQPQHPALLDEPVCFLDAPAATAFATWAARRTGIPWRLPHDQEWEKAARGVDGRAFPWGDYLDPSWTCMQLSNVGVPSRASVGAYPEDLSPYGVRGLGGNVRDWCANAYARGGPPEGDDLLRWEEAPETAEFRMIRGGCIASAAVGCRVAGRYAANAAHRGSLVGVRLFAPFTGTSSYSSG